MRIKYKRGGGTGNTGLKEVPGRLLVQVVHSVQCTVYNVQYTD